MQAAISGPSGDKSALEIHSLWESPQSVVTDKDKPWSCLPGLTISSPPFISSVTSGKFLSLHFCICEMGVVRPGYCLILGLLGGQNELVRVQHLRQFVQGDVSVNHSNTIIIEAIAFIILGSGRFEESRSSG